MLAAGGSLARFQSIVLEPEDEARCGCPEREPLYGLTDPPGHDDNARDQGQQRSTNQEGRSPIHSRNSSAPLTPYRIAEKHDLQRYTTQKPPKEHLYAVHELYPDPLGPTGRQLYSITSMDASVTCHIAWQIGGSSGTEPELGLARRPHGAPRRGPALHNDSAVQPPPSSELQSQNLHPTESITYGENGRLPTDRCAILKPERGAGQPMNDNLAAIAENLAKPCQKASQPSQAPNLYRDWHGMRGTKVRRPS